MIDEEKWLEDEVMKRALTRSLKLKKNKSAPCPYDSVHLVTLPYAYQCSNQCEPTYSKSDCVNNVGGRIHFVQSRIESSSKNDLNQLGVLKKDK